MTPANRDASGDAIAYCQYRYLHEPCQPKNHRRTRHPMHRWFLTLSVLLLPGIATAASLTVSPGQSIAAALRQLGSGETLTLQAGTYNENNLNVPSGATVQGSGSVVIRHTGG